ncbi:MAG: acyl-CoA dehydrogenase family protein [Burkholderiaceae bacterium]|nr:acyl-CoA dehydrogenase family protein [Burkholderiaceae bacterium]
MSAPVSLEHLSDESFRTEVRTWLRANLPPDMVRRSLTTVHPSREDMLGVTAVLAQRGWSVPNWPVEHGGPGWSAMRCQIFDEELVLAGGPANNIQGVSLAGPVLCAFGTPAQQARHLPGIREGKVFWSQGFSEPNSGSDLASLKTRAVRQGDHYVVDGQKIWTSQAMMADWIFCLVRTDPQAKPQRGISFLLVPARAPGITIRPIPSIDEGESLCEVFFESVRVPTENLVGEEGRGWDYAKYLLGKERVQTAEVPRNKFYLARLKDLAASETLDDRPLRDDPVFRERLAQLEIDLIALEAGVTVAISSGDPSPLTPSALKVLGCELMQRQLALQVEALGPYAAVFHPHDEHEACSGQPVRAADAGTAATDQPPGPAHGRGVAAEFLFRRACTIYGGSTEIQKNIIAKLLFSGHDGAPPAPSPERAMLRDSAERFVRGEYPQARRRDLATRSRAQADAGWRALAAQGFTALGIDEAAGGTGSSPADLAVVCEAFGATLLPESFLALSVQPGHLLSTLAMPDGQRASLLGALIAGECRIAVADAEPAKLSTTPGSPSTLARPIDGGFVLDGHKCAVIGATFASRFLVSAGLPDGRSAVFLVDADAAGLRLQHGRSIDGQSLADLHLQAVRLPAQACLTGAADAGATLRRWREHSVTMACADAVGAMGEAFRITRDYLGIRKQFGSPLAEFQALRHRMAEMYAELTISRALLARTIEALAGDDTERTRLVTACKARVGRAAMFVANQSVQLHGGIGMTDEYVIGQYYKRLFTFEASMGSAMRHTRRFAMLSDGLQSAS